MANEHDEVWWLHARASFSRVEVAECCGLSEGVLRELVDYGALPAAEPLGGDSVARLRRAARLCADLEMETPALALVLGFLERIDALEAEVRHLDAQLGRQAIR